MKATYMQGAHIGSDPRVFLVLSYPRTGEGETILCNSAHGFSNHSMNRLALYQLRVSQKVMRDHAAIIDMFPFEEDSATSNPLFRKGTTGIAPVEDATYIQLSKDRFLKALARLPPEIFIFALGEAAHTMLLLMGVFHIYTCHPSARHDFAQSGIRNQLYSQIRILMTVGGVQRDMNWWTIKTHAERTAAKAAAKALRVAATETRKREEAEAKKTRKREEAEAKETRKREKAEAKAETQTTAEAFRVALLESIETAATRWEISQRPYHSLHERRLALRAEQALSKSKESSHCNI
eukprot:CAMPEP_0173282560 /NCGR_PEP_ID=MMETSP1143-20121109/6887_1 /TAXON_ID=483371 /ORGANISM="non described non described, Strain CCMP2298" /LENGTH=293 /DNA_ID=CAMNT_0014220143 /DNA_START=1380 /DNA_END=2261 /DNA_ORIENTATION=-